MTVAWTSFGETSNGWAGRSAFSTPRHRMCTTPPPPGKALIIVGDRDTNVDRDDYFVHNLLGVEPLDWNKVSLPPVETVEADRGAN